MNENFNLLKSIVGEKHASRILETTRFENIGSLTRHQIGLPPKAFEKLQAGIELGRRIQESKTAYDSRQRISSSTDAVKIAMTKFARLASDGLREEFHIMTLDTKNNVIDTHHISTGTLDASLVHPREVFRPAIADAASSIILVHNHPSGDPTPSKQDLAVTDRLTEVGKTIGIDVLDHIVIGATGVSIRECR